MSTDDPVRAAGRAGTTVLVLLVLLVGCSSTMTGSSTDTPDAAVASDPADAPTGAMGDPSGATEVPADPAARAARPSSTAAGPSEAPPTSQDDGLPSPAVTTPPTLADVPATTDGTGTDACSVPVEPGTPGVTDEEIAVGIPRFRNLPAVLAEAPERDWHEYVQELVDHVNTAGGIACRRLQVVWHDVDVSNDRLHGPAGEQAMCATWTQDHRVLVAIPGGSDFPYDVLYPCLDQAGVAVIDVRGLSYRDAEAFARLPRLVNVNSARLDRGTREQVAAHVRRGFLSPGTRIGVVYYDEPRTTRTVDGTLIPALQTHGLALAERAAITPPGSAADFAAREQEVATAALRFKIEEIDRVLVVRSMGITSNFMNNAERNRYHPRYGLTTVELRVASMGEEWAVPEAQLVGAHGIGWLPDSDLHPRRPELWPARRACLEFFAERGFPTVTGIDMVLALAACEAVGFLRSSVEAAPPPLSADAVIAGSTSLGTGYESPLVRWTEFGPGRRDGAAAYRDAGYDRECDCFTYTSDPRPLP